MRQGQEAGMGIRIIITGGTFDKHYDAIKGLLTFNDTHLPEILTQVRCTVPIELELNQLIDSLEMLQENLQKVLDSCIQAKEEEIVITHGTDTMAETAKVLGEAGLAKRIILTGAMVPYSVVGSDALFNLGTAVMAVQLVPNGVYICMNGRCFPWNDVVKNRSIGVFETKH
jgi:L-asparaginase